MARNIKIIEHEPEIVTTHGTFKQSELKHLVVEEKPKPLAAHKEKHCPFKRQICKKNCALWNGKGCRIREGGNIQKEGVCPVSGETCNSNCIMYTDKNCALF